MQVEQKFFIGMQDVGNTGIASNKASNKALIEMLSNVATVHAIKVGQSALQRKGLDMIWMVINWKLQVIKRPAACTSVTARTWAGRYNKLKAIRDFEILNQAGEIIALATSDWVAIGPDRSSFIRLDESNMGPYQCEPDHESLPGTTFSKVREKDFEKLSETLLTIGRSMIDCNGHVHNTAYLDLVNEVLPDDLDEACFDHVEINYRKEILVHDTVRIELAAEKPVHMNDPEAAYAEEGSEPKYCIFVRSEDGKVLHATILLSNSNGRQKALGL